MLNVQTLYPIVKNIARGDDDTAQDIWLELLEASANDRRFSERGTGYHVRRAQFARGHVRRSRAVYDRYVCEEMFFVEYNGDETSVLNLIADTGETPEDTAIRAEQSARLQDATLTLTPNQRRAIRLLMGGYSNNEIAAKLEIKKAAVSLLISRAEAKLAEVLQ